MAAQIAVYLRPPGYGEMFTELGFGSLVERARAGAKRSELAERITIELLGEVCTVEVPAITISPFSIVTAFAT